MKLITKRTIITLIIMAIAILFLESCQVSRGCNGSSKMIGYGNSTQSVLKHNR